eukprot:scaffold48854_cov63-Phaeocystis_antarctica.AAC.7
MRDEHAERQQANWPVGVRERERHAAATSCSWLVPGLVPCVASRGGVAEKGERVGLVGWLTRSQTHRDGKRMG